MALHKFLHNVAASTGRLESGPIADAPPLDWDQFQQDLRNDARWLTPRAVDGFEAAEFAFLPADELQTLVTAVDRFRAIAHEVAFEEQPTAAQVEQALPELMRVLEVLRPDRYADPTALLIGKRLEEKLTGRLPATIQELRFETGEDASGGEAVWIWVILRDEAIRPAVFRDNVRAIRKLVTDAAAELGLKHWPYIHFRAASELEYLSNRVAP